MTPMALPTPTLHTARLRLRPFDDADANNLFALHSNAYVLRYWDAPPWSERVRAERFITACRQMAQGGTGAACNPRRCRSPTRHLTIRERISPVRLGDRSVLFGWSLDGPTARPPRFGPLSGSR
jgi:RimJ/RimL family protein N-acetyltransferase